MSSDADPTTRRSYLRLVGTATLAALAGCGDRGPSEETETERRETTADSETETTDDTQTESPGDTSTETPPDSVTEESEKSIEELRTQYDTVVNVRDAGADASGERVVNPVLDDNLDDDTLLYFPPGRYRLEPWQVIDYRNLGVVGKDATLVPPEGEQGYWLMCDELRQFHFQGFELDTRARGVAPANFLTVTGGTNVVRDVSLRGHRRIPRGGFEISVGDPNAELLFDRVSLPDGSTAGNAIYTFPSSVGKLTLRDCYVEHWAEGLYASPHSGPLSVLGGYYGNNGIDQVRVGGGPSGALVRGVTVRVDQPKQPSQKPNMRGIWMEEGATARIENCDVAITNLTGTYSSGGIVVGRQAGAATIRNTRIRVDEDVPAINLRNPVEGAQGSSMPSMGRLPTDRRVTCEDVRIEGDAAAGPAILTTRRDDCLFDRLCLHQPNGKRDGIAIMHADGCTVRDSTIAVGGRAITTEGARVRQLRVRRQGSCS
ncbi:hypothetical protein [Halorussus halophilus]|uniref:hypothetical protein n=1 Tax=Halorussus halophilus TaxID=2650975 RepID=UPI0013015325|nr:hypothetical protein [Halorussus halophilus]